MSGGEGIVEVVVDRAAGDEKFPRFGAVVNIILAAKAGFVVAANFRTSASCTSTISLLLSVYRSVRFILPMPLMLLTAFCGLAAQSLSSYVVQKSTSSTTIPRFPASVTKFFRRSK